ncbi:MAG: DUF1553 domain-containing protein, partial [Planctomycetaceae bacterium]|nr:DUF1553 domain-containing protein [Planctomycetaceae bacterium]
WVTDTSAQVHAAGAEVLPDLVELTAESDAVLTRQSDGSWLVSGSRPQFDVYVATFALPSSPAAGAAMEIAGIRLDVLTDPALPAQGPGRADNGNFVLSEVTVDVGSAADLAPTRRVPFVKASADFSQKGFEVAKAIDGVENAVGWAVSPQLGQTHSAVLTLQYPIESGDAEQRMTIRLSQQYEQPGQTPHLLGRFKLTLLTPAHLASEGLPDNVRDVLLIDPAKRDGKQQALLFDHFAATDADHKRLQAAVTKHRQAEPFKPEFPVAVLRERSDNRRETKVFRRGSFLEPLGDVTSQTLEVLPPLPTPAGREPTRLELAQWLVSTENPLTPRVVVNQFWSHLFGRGIVNTPTDFGVRGESPSHPELLDWLSTELLRLGWSRKQLLRTILLSHTYRQSPVHRPEQEEIDPENRLLARQNRFRVEAEIVRDLYLAAAGLLEPRIGGPSVFPTIPPGIAELSYANNFKWGASDWNKRPDNPHGVPPEQDIYRRGMYTFFKRTAAHPNLVTFDCPDANTTCVARRVSNTPLQALQTLNNDIFTEAARALAVDAMKVAALDDAARIEWLFRRCNVRPPEPYEAHALESLLADSRHEFGLDAPSAETFCGQRREAAFNAIEQAAWTTLARVVLNLDEFLTRE